MTIEEIQEQLARPATRLSTGGFKPSNQIDECWLGRVFLYAEDEEIPRDHTGKLMFPLAQLYLPGLPHCSTLLKETELITLFISSELPKPFEAMGANWVIREYKSVDELQRRHATNPDSPIKAFPFKPIYVEKDFPVWEDNGIPVAIGNAILELEKAGQIESYYDIGKHTDGHKVGGYPSFCQSGVHFGQGFEFVFQISSDAKANLNIVDGGSLMFSKNVTTREWKLYFDFY